jgi:3-keto-disaccharide hydrolase
MRTLLVLSLLAVCPAFAASPDFNGRWDIHANTTPRPRAWWVELSGVGTPQAAGKFVSAYNGDMNIIDTITVENGELRFTINPPSRNAAAKKAPAGPSIYRAKYVNGKLEGTFVLEGGTNPPIPWTGVRAPVIKDRDDGSWKEGKPIALFNGKDISGWKALVPGVEMKWTVVDGVLRNAPPTTDIISEQKFWNFKLHVDFRIVEHSNSGIGLRGRYEVQILEDYGKPAQTHGAGALYSRVAPSVNASKPAGEWQSYDIRLVGRQLTVVHNGIKVLDKVEVEGLTAIANNADEAEPGPFIVQGDHSYVEIKSFVVTPLVQ